MQRYYDDYRQPREIYRVIMVAMTDINTARGTKMAEEDTGTDIAIIAIIHGQMMRDRMYPYFQSGLKLERTVRLGVAKRMVVNDGPMGSR